MAQPMPESEIEILRVGKFISSNGVEVDINPSVLQQVVATYNPQNFKAPLIVSHSTGGVGDRDLAESELAYGWPKALRVVGDRIKATFEKISPQFTQWVRDGQLMGISSSLYTPDSAGNPYPGQWALRHIAGLGKNPPAIKGLAPLALSEWQQQGGKGVIDFDEFDIGSGDSVTVDLCDCDRTEMLSEAMQRIREGIIDSAGVEVANRLLPQALIQDFQEAKKPQVLLADGDAEGTTTAATKVSAAIAIGEEIDMSEEDLRERIKALEKDKETLTAQIAAESWKARRAMCASFCETLQRKGILTPAMLQPRSIEFSEGNETKRDNLGLVDFMAELSDRQRSFVQGLLEKLPKQVHFQEVAGDGKIPPADGSNLDAKKLAEEATRIYREKRGNGQEPTFAECVEEAKKAMGVVEV